MGMTIQLQSTSDATLPMGTLSVGPVNFTGNIAPQFDLVNLVSGANTITVPSGSIGVIITPPTTNAIALTFKGVTGDTGNSLPAATPSIFVWGTAPSSFCLTAANNTTGNTQLIFF